MKCSQCPFYEQIAYATMGCGLDTRIVGDSPHCLVPNLAKSRLLQILAPPKATSKGLLATIKAKLTAKAKPNCGDCPATYYEDMHTRCRILPYIQFIPVLADKNWNRPCLCPDARAEYEAKLAADADNRNNNVKEHIHKCIVAIENDIDINTYQRYVVEAITKPKTLDEAEELMIKFTEAFPEFIATIKEKSYL